MRKRLILFKAAIYILLQSASVFGNNLNEPDSAYIFSYSTQKNSGRNGLHFAWSIDRENWHAIGPEYRFLFCDYGSWGTEKRLISPFLFPDKRGLWHCVWSLNEKDGVFAHAASNDLVYWYPQSYPVVMSDNNCMMPEISYDATNDVYQVSWLSKKDNITEAYYTTTEDFKSYSSTKPFMEENRLNLRENIKVSDNTETGTVHKVAWKTIEGLIRAQELASFKRLLNSESSKDDSTRFEFLKTLNMTINADISKSKNISDMLMGIFFEDINYAADGGLYAELIQNRDFEYSLNDTKGRDTSWHSFKCWSINGSDVKFVIDTISPIHPNNKNYAVLQMSKIGASLVNEGFDGIPVTKDDKYDFSFFARNMDGKNKKLFIRLIGKNDKIVGETTVNVNSSTWKKVNCVLMANATVPDAKLAIVPQTAGEIAIDMISLFPQKTFKGRKNGLRADLAQVIADIHPRFVRFPGGCVAHGDGLDNIYRWKNTVGPLEARKPQPNIWRYHQTAGPGYVEYFLFCEDVGAEPLPVIAAGVPCQNSSTGGAGQQGGIPMCEMDSYVQEILDLIEWANGDANTRWGKIRAEAGHPKPFNLKYIGIGNEDLITDIFEERFTMIFNAIKEKHPEITVIGTVGPFFEGTDYTEGWKIATKLGVPMVDEHYYQSPGWFINNQDFYDKYDRSKSKVYLGEYAAHLPGRPNNIETALAEALYLTALERNGDVVKMASYAPLLAKEKHTQWNPNLIYFNNTEVKPTVGYYVQKLYGQNSGDTYIESNVKLSDNNDKVRKRVAVSLVRDSKTNDLILKMVNLLPVNVDTKVHLDGITNINPSASMTLLTGKPNDRKALPVTNNLMVSENFQCTLPAYSFTLIRINNVIDK